MTRSIREISQNFKTANPEQHPALCKEVVRFVRDSTKDNAIRLIQAIAFQCAMGVIEASKQGPPLVLAHAQLIDKTEEALEWLELHGGHALPPNEPGLKLLIQELQGAIDKAKQITLNTKTPVPNPPSLPSG